MNDGNRWRGNWWGRFFLILILTFVFTGGAVGQKRIHTVHFEGTDHELHVYRIYGSAPGKTLMLIGGIQGDEPGGFLSADLYADIALSKGNLIVVPRANFPSILENRRQINADMNRTFDGKQDTGYESQVVLILKRLIAQSDALLNLHDGSGFYAPTWESESRNPMRFGQSIIADTATFTRGDGTVLDLAAMAKKVVAAMNPKIADPAHRFRFNNHRTGNTDSLHKEQRKSATFYALTRCGIPAFGVETSKSLPLELKVRHHNFAINGFMDLFGIAPETPGVRLESPALRYLVITVDGQTPVVVEKNETLTVPKGAVLTVSHIEANYERGLAADILGVGGRNDLRNSVVIDTPTRIVVRKDNYPCGSVGLAVGAKGRSGTLNTAKQTGDHLFYRVRVGQKEQIVPNNGTVAVARGKEFEIVSVISGAMDPADLVVNFKGFVGNRDLNTGEDRGYPIDTAKDLWLRYSEDGKGRFYKVVTTRKDAVVGGMIVEIIPQKAPVLLVQNSDGSRNWFVNGDRMGVGQNCLPQIFSLSDAGATCRIAGEKAKGRQIPLAEPVVLSDLFQNGEIPAGSRIELLKFQVPVGTVTVDVTEETGSGKVQAPVDH